MFKDVNTFQDNEYLQFEKLGTININIVLTQPHNSNHVMMTVLYIL